MLFILDYFLEDTVQMLDFFPPPSDKKRRDEEEVVGEADDDKASKEVFLIWFYRIKSYWKPVWLMQFYVVNTMS